MALQSSGIPPPLTRQRRKIAVRGAHPPRITTGKTIEPRDGVSARKTHYHGALRHRSVALICPIGISATGYAGCQGDALSWRTPPQVPFSVLSVPCRCHLVHSAVACEHEPIHDFRDRCSWYTTKVIYGKLRRRQKQLDENTQRTWIGDVLQAASIDSTKVTHAPRKPVARMADLCVIEIMRAGD